MRVWLRCSGAMTSGVTMKAWTPLMVVGRTVTWRRWRTAGRVCMVSAACLLAKARHSAPVFMRLFQLGLRGAAMSFWSSGLTSVGTGRDLAGTCSGAGLVEAAVWATAGTHASAVRANTRDLVRFMNEVPPVTGDWIRGEGERAQKQGSGIRDQGS